MEAISGKINEVLKQLNKSREKRVVQGKNIEFNRKILESKKVKMLILSHKDKRDRLKERNSGLNQVLCKLARENNITLAIDFNELREEEKKERAKILARIIQNIKLIKKFRNKLIIINRPEDKQSLQALLRILGANTKLAKEVAEWK